MSRFVLEPACIGKVASQCAPIACKQIAQCPRADRFSENGKASALFRPQVAQRLADRDLGFAPTPRLATKRNSLRPVRIVKVENGRLHYRVGRTETGWMIGISFDLCRAALVALHQNTG